MNVTPEQIVRACELARDFKAGSIRVATPVVYGLPDDYIVIELGAADRAAGTPVVFGIDPDGVASSSISFCVAFVHRP